MLRAPVLMRAIRSRGSLKHLSSKESLVSRNSGSFRSSRANSHCVEFTRLDSQLSNDVFKDESKSKDRFNLEEGFRVKISEVSSGNERCVYYKDDEDRFTQRHTLKLLTQATYKVTLEIEARVRLSDLKFGGVFWNSFDVKERPDGCTVEYSFMWRAEKMESTTRKHRSVLPCVVKLKNNEEIKFAVLVKFYNEFQEEHNKGVPLSFLTLDRSEGSVSQKGYRRFHKMVFH